MANGGDFGERVGHFVGDVFGFFWYLLLLSGAYGLGVFVAGYFLGEDHKDAMGLLAALAVIWQYERLNAQHRWERTIEMFDRLHERLNR